MHVKSSLKKYSLEKENWEKEDHYCQNCGEKLPKLYDDIFGSGRFCSNWCAKSYSNKNHITIERLNNGDYNYPNTTKVRTFLLRNNIKKYVCECCGRSEWMGKQIVLELHHIDGDQTNNKLDNLQLLCPNCHSITDNWKSKNKS